MPDFETWIGHRGPFFHSDTITDVDDPDYTVEGTPVVYLDSDEADALFYDIVASDSTDAVKAFKINDPIIATASATSSQHLTRRGDVETDFIQSKSVADIASPKTELNLVAGTAGTILVAFQVVGSGVQDNVTLYAYDAETLTESTPYILNAKTSGTWIARGGRYTADDFHLKVGKKLYLEGDSYFVYDSGKVRLYVDGTLEAQWG